MSDRPPGDPHPLLPVDPDLDPTDRAEPTVGRRGRTQPGADQGAVGSPSVGTRRVEPRVLAAIALGGALGAPARYGVAQLIHVADNSFPWATFWTNVSGSFALGLILVLILERFPPTRYLRPFVATGFLGAYTTYSTFAVETDLLFKNGHPWIGLAYAVASLAAGFVAVWAGIAAARVFQPSPRAQSGGGIRS